MRSKHTQRPRLISAKVAAALRNRLDPTSKGLPLADPPLNRSTLAVEPGPALAHRPPRRTVRRYLGQLRRRPQHIIGVEHEPIMWITTMLRRLQVPVGQLLSGDLDCSAFEQRIANGCPDLPHRTSVSRPIIRQCA